MVATLRNEVRPCCSLQPSAPAIRARMNWRRLLAGAGAAAMLGGCGTVPPQPLPVIDLAATDFVAATTPIRVELAGPSGKLGGIGSAAVTGAGWGLGLGLLGEMGCSGATCGFTTLFVGMAGAVSGALVGVVAAENADEIQARRDLLGAAVASNVHTPALTDLLRAQAPRRAAAADAGRWQVTAEITSVGNTASGRYTPYAVQMAARLQVRQMGDTAPAAERRFAATSTAAHLTRDWGADGAAPLRRALDECVRALATQMTAALSPPAPPRAEARLGKPPAADPGAG